MHDWHRYLQSSRCSYEGAMRYLRWLVLLLFCSMALASTPTKVQMTTAHGASSTLSTGSLTTTTGNSVYVACGFNSTSGTLSASDGTNTYTGVGSGTTSQATEGQGRWFVAKNITGVTHVITCTCTTCSVSFSTMFVYELSGASTSSPVDVPGRSG